MKWLHAVERDLREMEKYLEKNLTKSWDFFAGAFNDKILNIIKILENAIKRNIQQNKSNKNEKQRDFVKKITENQFLFSFL